jgi:hypothetical protein
MNNGKIFYNDLIGNCTLTVTSEAQGYEKEYLANNNQGVVWRSTGISENNITMTFDAPATVKGIVVMNYNLETGDTFLFEASADNFSSTAQSQAVDPLKGLIEVDWNYRYYRLRLQKTGGDYIQVGEIYLFGSAYEFEKNFKWNYTYTREINRNSKQTTSGQVYRSTRFVRKGFNIDFEGVTDTQKTMFESIVESDYINFLPTGSDGDRYYGTMDFSAFTHVYTNYWSVSASFMENPR